MKKKKKKKKKKKGGRGDGVVLRGRWSRRGGVSRKRRHKWHRLRILPKRDEENERVGGRELDRWRVGDGEV